MKAGEVSKGNWPSSARKRLAVKVVKKTIQTVGRNSLKNTVRLDETLNIRISFLGLFRGA